MAHGGAKPLVGAPMKIKVKCYLLLTPHEKIGVIKPTLYLLHFLSHTFISAILLIVALQCHSLEHSTYIHLQSCLY